MPHWIIMHRDAEGDIHRLDGLWEADSAEAAIAQMLGQTGRADDGHWRAEQPHEREDMMSWHLDADSKGKPESTDEARDRDSGSQ